MQRRLICFLLHAVSYVEIGNVHKQRRTNCGRHGIIDMTAFNWMVLMFLDNAFGSMIVPFGTRMTALQ